MQIQKGTGKELINHRVKYYNDITALSWACLSEEQGIVGFVAEMTYSVVPQSSICEQLRKQVGEEILPVSHSLVFGIDQQFCWPHLILYVMVIML